MTREEAKEFLPIIKAYSEGGIVQNKSLNNGWKDLEDDVYFNTNPNGFRIKPATIYRPFMYVNECWEEMKKHQPFGWVKKKTEDIYLNICVIGFERLDFDNYSSPLSYRDVFKQFTFADGEPFGVKEEE